MLFLRLLLSCAAQKIMSSWKAEKATPDWLYSFKLTAAPFQDSKLGTRSKGVGLRGLSRRSFKQRGSEASAKNWGEALKYF